MGRVARICSLSEANILASGVGGWPRLLTSLVPTTQWMPRPSLSLRRAGVGNARSSALITLHNKSNGTGSIATHPCKKRKNGAPSVGMVCRDTIKSWATRRKIIARQLEQKAKMIYSFELGNLGTNHTMEHEIC